MGKTRGFDSVLSGRCASRVGDLTLDLIKSPSNPLSGTRIRRGFDHLTCPNGGVFNHLFDQIPTLPHTLPQGGIVGPTIDRCIKRIILLSCTDSSHQDGFMLRLNSLYACSWAVICQYSWCYKASTTIMIDYKITDYKICNILCLNK